MGSPVSHRQAEDVYSFMMATLTLTVKPIYPLIVCLMNYLGLVEHYMNKKILESTQSGSLLFSRGNRVIKRLRDLLKEHSSL